MRLLAQARNPYSRSRLWIPGSLVSLAPRNDDLIELHHHRRIRQFVAPRPMRGKMRRQLPRDRLDPLDDAALEIPRLEIGLHGLADFLPARGADLRIDAAIADDPDLAGGPHHIGLDAPVVRD